MQARMSFWRSTLVLDVFLRPLVRTWKHMNVSTIAGFLATSWRKRSVLATKACGSTTCLSWKEFGFHIIFETVCMEVDVSFEEASIDADS